MRVRSGSPEATAAIGAAVGRTAPRGGVLALHGPLGAGKTALAQAVLAALGVPGPHPSPTFTIMRRYERPGGGAIWHVDAYRLAGAGQDGGDGGSAARTAPPRAPQPEDLGWDEVFAPGAVVVVEWAEHLGAVLPDDRLRVRIERESGGQERTLHLSGLGRCAARWLDRTLADLGGTGETV